MEHTVNRKERGPMNRFVVLLACSIKRWGFVALLAILLAVPVLSAAAAEPPRATAAWVATGTQATARFGSSAAAGDVNGDGFADLVAGAPYYTNGESEEGAVYVYYGSAAGLSSTPVVVESGQAGARMGWSVGAADVNGDGFDDVVAGAPYYTNGESEEGAVHVYYGSAAGLSSTPAVVVESNQAAAHFGYSVGSAGDVNGDGSDDVVIGAPYAGDQAEEGRAFVYYGAASGLNTSSAWTVESNQAGAHLGYSVGAAGDVNGDGFADVAIGAPDYEASPQNTNEGVVRVYYGSSSGISATSPGVARGGQAGARLGWSVGAAGDVNGDGYDDVVAGAINAGSGGRAYVYRGSAAGLNTTPAWTLESDQAGANFGWSAIGVGDVNGDGYADVAVGAPDYDHPQNNEGCLFVYRGSAAGLGATPAWTAESDQDLAYFGSALAAGDVNGDGYADVVAGAPYYAAGQGQGRVFVYHGDDLDVDGMADDWEIANGLNPNQNDAAGDLDGDGLTNLQEFELGTNPSQSDSDGDGIPDLVEVRDPNAPADTDGDGTIDALDLDSDGDGIPDLVEGVGDRDGDHTPNYLDVDADGDGIPDLVEGAGDPDGDRIPNFLDFDSDGDGILDLVEGTGDVDGDDTPNFLDTDSDGDSIPDVVEGISDRDGDGTPNYLDIESDGDGIPDRTEDAGDADGDGTPNFLDLDSDGDGIPDIVEGMGDRDADGTPNFLDLEADGDNIPDAVECPGLPCVDTDGDGVANYLDKDSDGDGKADLVEGTGDVDGDGIPNYIDANDGDGPAGDADGDTISNRDENIPGLEDADGDGTPNFLDLDSDDDGIPDSVEAGDADINTPPIDTDGLGYPDFIDPESDNDGIPDNMECSILPCADTDHDGLPNYRDTDSDGDGVPDELEGAGDPDGDRIPNYMDLDSNGDGALDSVQCPAQPCADTDGDGTPDFLEMSTGTSTTIYLPLVIKSNNGGSSTPTPSQEPDLVVEALVVTGNGAQVRVKNVGPGTVTDAFWVDVYLNPGSAPTGPNQTWQTLGAQGMAWGVIAPALPMASGRVITLTTGDPYYWSSLSSFSTPLPAGVRAYAQADSAGRASYGAVLETHEASGGAYNNIAGPALSTAGVAGQSILRHAADDDGTPAERQNLLPRRQP
jgi:hypothetical protein